MQRHCPRKLASKSLAPASRQLVLRSPPLHLGLARISRLQLPASIQSCHSLKCLLQERISGSLQLSASNAAAGPHKADASGLHESMAFQPLQSKLQHFLGHNGLLSQTQVVGWQRAACQLRLLSTRLVECRRPHRDFCTSSNFFLASVSALLSKNDAIERYTTCTSRGPHTTHVHQPHTHLDIAATLKAFNSHLWAETLQTPRLLLVYGSKSACGGLDVHQSNERAGTCTWVIFVTVTHPNCQDEKRQAGGREEHCCQQVRPLRHQSIPCV